MGLRLTADRRSILWRPTGSLSVPDMGQARIARTRRAVVRLVTVVGGLPARASNVPYLRPLAAIAGTALVITVSWGAWRSADLDGLPTWALLGVGVLMMPLVLALNGAEFKLQASMVGVHLGWSETARYVGQASVANMLPVPGGPILRHRVLATRGASQRMAVRAQLMTAIWWLAAGLVVSGLSFVAAAGRWWLGLAMAAGGGVLWVAGWSMRPTTTDRLGDLGWLALVEVATVMLGAIRFWAVAVLIGATLDAAGAFSMAFTSPAAAALGIFPSGIGAREALIGVTAKVIEADASLLFLAAAIERVVSLVAAVPVLTWSLWGRRHPSHPEAGLPDAPPELGEDVNPMPASLD